MPCFEEARMMNNKNYLVASSSCFSPTLFVFKWNWNFIDQFFACFLTGMVNLFMVYIMVYLHIFKLAYI